MKKLLIFLGALAAYGQTVSLSDTLTNAVGGGSFTGRITVTLNAPGNAQPLYYSTTSLTGWQAVYCLGVTGSDCTTTTSAGTFAATLYANSTITPAGTSYSARFSPSKGSPWSETWVITPSTTTLRQVRSTTVPTPTVMFAASQITPGTSGQVLTTSGGATVWAAASGGGAVSSVFGRTGAITATSGDYTAAQVTNAVSTAGSYADPAWITSLAYSKLTGVPSLAPTACEVVIGDPGAATPLLADDNDAPASCVNVSGVTQTITEIACYANAGSPTVRPIVTGGSATSLLSADLTCGTGSYATGTLNGTPTMSANATIDANIASAGGVAKYIVIRITRRII